MFGGIDRNRWRYGEHGYEPVPAPPAAIRQSDDGDWEEYRIPADQYQPFVLPERRANRPSIHERVRARRGREANEGGLNQDELLNLGGKRSRSRRARRSVSRSRKTTSSQSEWIEFVKGIQRKRGCSFKEALIIASPLYRRHRK